MANYKSERELNFENLDGENITYILKKDEKLLETQCPLDQTYLIQKMTLLIALLVVLNITIFHLKA